MDDCDSPITSYDPGSISTAMPRAIIYVEANLKKIVARVVEKATQLCISKSVNGVVVEGWEGDARNVLCEAVEKHQASILVLGSHGYGAIKREVLGSVSDYAAIMFTIL